MSLIIKDLRRNEMDFTEELQKLKEEVDTLRKSLIGLQNSHIKMQEKVYREESKENYEEIWEEHKKHCDWCRNEEEDSWNLADNEWNVPDGDGRAFSLKDIKTFIQKVKEDVQKEYYKHIEDRSVIPIQRINEILDKRAGKL